MNRLKESWASLKRIYGYEAYIFIAIILYSVVCSAGMLTIYSSFRIYTWDLGVFNQAFWNTLKGRLFYYTCEPFYTTTGNFLGAHFGPILFLILPIYAIYPRPETLLVISPIIAALGAIPAYKIARLFLKDDKVATLLGVFYLLYLPLQGVVISGFSLELVALPLFLFIIYFLVDGDFKKLPLAVMLGLMTHEASAPVIAFIGLYGMWYYKSPKSGGFRASLIISVVSMIYFVFAQNMRILLGWTQRPSLWHEWTFIGAENPTSLPFKIITNPLGAWRSLAFDGPMKVAYLLMLFVPAGFLPLFGLPGLLPAIPYLALTLFSSYGWYYSIESHYGAFVIPFFFIALIHGIMKLQKNERADAKYNDVAQFVVYTFLSGMCFVGTIIQSALWALPGVTFFIFAFWQAMLSVCHSGFRVRPMKMVKVILLLTSVSLIAFLPISYIEHVGLNSRDEHERILYQTIAMIPPNASILTQSDIFPHVSSRINAYTIPPPMWARDYLQIAKEMLQNLTKVKIDYVIIDLNGEPYAASGGKLILEEFIHRENCYNTLVNEDGVKLFKLET